MDRKTTAGRWEIKSTASGEVEAVFATLNCVDKDADVTLPGAFKNGAPVAISAFGHRSWEGALPVGRGTVHEVGNEVIMRGRLFLDTTGGRDTFATIKEMSEEGGPGMEWSYGYKVLDSARGEFQGKPVRFLKSLDVMEVSPVLQGAGVNTRVLTIKSYGSVQDELRAIDQELTRLELDSISRKLGQDIQYAADQAMLDEAARTVSYAYSCDLPSAVLSEVKLAARAAVETYAPKYGVDPRDVTVKYFSAESDPEHTDIYSLRPLKGYCYPKRENRTVYVRSDLDPFDTWSVAAHELAHVLGGLDEDEATLRGIAAGLDWEWRATA